MTEPGPRVVVAVLTFHRNELLARLLPQLAEQAVQLDPPAGILVVDNDPAGGAAEVVSAHPAAYLHEPTPGISAARNRALDHAADADALVFIDDDELPEPGWLITLVARWREWGCSAVTGPAVPELENPDAVSPWVLASGAFTAPLRRTGERVPGAATNNLLVDMRDVRRLGIRFEEALGLTGGEDTMFSHTLVDRGGEIRWCQEASVRDVIPSARATRRWILTRDLRAGASWSAMELALAGTRKHRVATRASLLVRGLVKTGFGLVQFGRGRAARNLPLAAAGLRTAASYLGMLYGVAGRSPQEYRRITTAGQS